MLAELDPEPNQVTIAINTSQMDMGLLGGKNT